jgi:hypothetical protein
MTGPRTHSPSCVGRRDASGDRCGRRDEGTVIPLILGFWLIAAVFVGGTVALSDAFTRQRDLQSICDSAAIAGANSISPDAAHGAGVASTAVPLGAVEPSVNGFLARDASRGNTTIQTQVETDGVTVDLVCRQHSQLAFGALLLRANGIDQVARASARSPLLP